MTSPWINPPSGRNAQTFDSPTFTGPRTGVTYPLAQSWTAVNVPADTSEDAVATITIPANTLRAGDALRIITSWSCTNNANVKTVKVHYSAIGGTTYMTLSLANQTSGASETIIANVTTSSQIGAWAAAGVIPTVSGSAQPTSSVDTTASSTVVITGQKATAGDTLTLNGYIVEVIRA